jgi:hypothetical protein
VGKVDSLTLVFLFVYFTAFLLINLHLRYHKHTLETRLSSTSIGLKLVLNIHGSLWIRTRTCANAIQTTVRSIASTKFGTITNSQ